MTTTTTTSPLAGVKALLFDVSCRSPAAESVRVGNEVVNGGVGIRNGC